MKRNATILAIMAVVLVGVWFIFERQTQSSEDGHESEVSIEISEALQGGTVEQAEGTNTERYTNETYGFSFTYPKGLSISTIPDLGGETLLVRGGEREFQIYISPFDESGSITPERIKQDLPGLVIKEPQQVRIGENKDVGALIFLGESEDFGETREVWFVREGHLYQVIAEAGSDAFVGPILESLRFQE